MRFACEQCGRSYAVADELRGKTFKMKCKACGHLIVVKGTPAAEAAARARGAPGANPTPSPVIIPGAPGDEPLERRPPNPEVNPFVARPISAASLEGHGAAAQHAEAGAASLAAPPSEQYIDLVLDEEASAGAPGQGERETPRDFSLPRHGAAFRDPFADLEALGDVGGPLAEPFGPRPAHPAPQPAGARVPPPRARPEAWPEAPAPPAPAPEGLNPKVLAIAGAVAVAVVAVLLLVFVGRSGKSSSPSPPLTAQAAPPAAAPAPPVPAEARPAAAQPAPGPSLAEPVPAIAQPEPAREEPSRRRAETAQRKPKPVRLAREERGPEPGPEPGRSAPPAPGPPPEPPRAAPAPAAAPGASAAPPRAAPPAPDEVSRIVSANKRAFEQCIAEASKRDSGLDLSGRLVTLMLTVNPNGKVVSPTIDDVGLAKTDLGACLESAARLMMFPAFEGEPMKVEVPLALGR